MIMFRFIDLDETAAYYPKSAALPMGAQLTLDNLLNDSLEEQVPLIANHLAGNTEGSPYLSLTNDLNKASATTDDSPGGLAGIVRGAAFIGMFDIPQNSERLVGVAGGLGGQEGEYLYRPAPGTSLKDFLVALLGNPYRASLTLSQKNMILNDWAQRLAD